jgi:hypothetical protein
MTFKRCITCHRAIPIDKLLPSGQCRRCANRERVNPPRQVYRSTALHLNPDTFRARIAAKVRYVREHPACSVVALKQLNAI